MFENRAFYHRVLNLKNQPSGESRLDGFEKEALKKSLPLLFSDLPYSSASSGIVLLCSKNLSRFCFLTKYAFPGLYAGKRFVRIQERIVSSGTVFPGTS